MNTEQHLRRLRIRLTAIYAALMAVALVILSLLVINADRRVRSSEMNTDLLARAQFGAGFVSFDEGRIDTTEFRANDDITGGYPQLWVYEATGIEDRPVRTVAGPSENYFRDSDLQGLAGAVVLDETSQVWDVWGGADDIDLRAQGIPVFDPTDNAGPIAVVAVANVDDWLDGSGALRARVLAFAAALVLASAAAGYWLAGRNIQPAADALHQQERLIADAAHELRTPVARILAAAEGGIAGDEEPDEALERVVTVAGDAGTALDDLLALARMDAGRQSVAKEPLRLDQLAETVAASYPGVKVEVVETVVDGDPGLLRRAVDNLLRNALAHGHLPNEEPRVTLTVYPKRVMVSDRGPGLDGTDQIFERFHSRTGSTGHGLGLPIVEWVATAHGGRVLAENREGGGATFTMVLR